MVQHRRAVLVVEGHVVHQDVALCRPHLPGVRGVLDGGLHPHQLHEALEARHAVEELLHKGGQLAHRGQEGGDIQGEGDQINEIHLTPHDEPAARRHGEHIHDGQGELQPAVINGHGLVIIPLGPLELLIGGLKLLVLLILTGEGLGGAHPGDGGLQLSVDARHGLLLPHGGRHHPPALDDGEHHENGHHGKDNEGQLPLDGGHHAERADESDRRDEQILRSVVGQLGDLKQVVGGPAHELAGAVLVVKGEGQVLHVAEQVPADIRLDAHAHHVPPVGDDEVHHRAQHIGPQQNGHDGEESGVQPLGQQGVQRLPGGGGKGQIHQGDAQGAGHIENKQLQVRFIIGQENRHVAPLEPVGSHMRTLLLQKIFDSRVKL